MAKARIGISLGAAWAGLIRTLKSELNFQIELAITILIVILGFFVGLERWEWIMLIITIMIVLGFELLNTSFERLSDLQKPRLDPLVKLAKDASAAAVLVASLGAIAVGILLLGPHLLTILL